MTERYRIIPDWIYYFLVLPLLALLPSRMGYLGARLQGRILFRNHKAIRQSASFHIGRILHRSASEGALIVLRMLKLRVAEELDVWSDLLRKKKPGRFTLEGLEYLDKALLSGRGVLLMSGHFGAICTGIVGLSYRGYRLCALANDSSRDHTMGWALRKFSSLKLNWMRKRMNGQMVLMQMHSQDQAAAMASAQLVSLLRENRCVAMALDVPPSLAKNKLPVRFLGEACCFPSGLLTLSKLTGAPIIPFFTIRDPSHWAKHRIILQPPLALSGQANKDLQLCVQSLESMIRRFPDHWNLWEAFSEFQPETSTSDRQCS